MRQVKVVFLGDAGVGKTSVITRKTTHSFDFKMLPTLGSGHDIVEVVADHEAFRLLVWDTAGQERYDSITPYYLQGTDVVCVVGSAVDPASIESMGGRWLALVRATGDAPALIAVVTKMDLVDGPGIAAELGERLLAQFADVAFVSARTNEGIDALFEAVARTGAAQARVGAAVEEEVGVRRGCC
jgi:small GTP-binding protein